MSHFKIQFYINCQTCNLLLKSDMGFLIWKWHCCFDILYISPLFFRRWQQVASLLILHFLCTVCIHIFYELEIMMVCELWALSILRNGVWQVGFSCSANYLPSSTTSWWAQLCNSIYHSITAGPDNLLHVGIFSGMLLTFRCFIYDWIHYIQQFLYKYIMIYCIWNEWNNYCKHLYVLMTICSLFMYFMVQRAEDGLMHQEPMPQVPEPEKVWENFKHKWIFLKRNIKWLYYFEFSGYLCWWTCEKLLDWSTHTSVRIIRVILFKFMMSSWSISLPSKTGSSETISPWDGLWIYDCVIQMMK